MSAFPLDGDPWQTHAACRDVDPDMFHHESAIDDAKLICDGCKVKSWCLDDAIRRDEPLGVRGGLTPAERRKLHRRAIAEHRSNRYLKPIEHGTRKGYRQHQRRGVPVCKKCEAAG